MTEVIVDTNVAVVANDQNTEIIASCVDACKLFLIGIAAGQVVLVDGADEIRAEYARAVGMGRPYQLGAQFLVHVLRHQYDVRVVRRIDLPRRPDDTFEDFPDVPELSMFDLSDRKFAVLARKTGTPVTNATDSDWADFRDALNAHGIKVDFLCGCRKDDWFTDPRRIVRPRATR